MKGRQLCPNCCRELKTSESSKKSHWSVQTEICTNCGSRVYNINRLKAEKYAVSVFIPAIISVIASALFIGVKLSLVLFLLLTVAMLLFDTKFAPAILKKINADDPCQYFVLLGQNNRRFTPKPVFRAEIFDYQDFGQFRADNILLLYNGKNSCFVTVKKGVIRPFCEFSVPSPQKSKLLGILNDTPQILLSDGEKEVGKVKVLEVYP